VFRNIIFEILNFFQKILHKNVFKDLFFFGKMFQNIGFCIFYFKTNISRTVPTQ